MFSILIPTWNNLPFLKLCVEGIRKNSAYPHQVIIHVNEGSDGTLEWVKQAGIECTYSPENIGICKAVNAATQLITKDYVVFMNDDMYPLPGWDKILLENIEQLKTDCFLCSGTMIEPYHTGNTCVIVKNYGENANEFRKDTLLKDFTSLAKPDWSGATWPPTIVHRTWWEKVGGYSEEFSPGMSSDNDFAMKMWDAGCRIFMGVGDSRVYHFISKSTGRVKKNNGRKQFLKKWGIKQSTFDKYYLKRGEPYTGALTEPTLSPGLLLQKVLAVIQR